MNDEPSWAIIFYTGTLILIGLLSVCSVAVSHPVQRQAAYTNNGEKERQARLIEDYLFVKTYFNSSESITILSVE